MTPDSYRDQFEIIFFDNSDHNHDLLPKTKIALFVKRVMPMPGNLDPRKFQAYMNPYLILSGMIIKDILARKNIKVLINSFYNYLKPTRYDILVLDKTRIIHTFSSVEEFFYDILYPEDKGKTRPLEKTPLRDPQFLNRTMSNTQFIRLNPGAEGEVATDQMLKTNLDVGVQVFHFEKVYTIYDKLNNIIIPEEKAIQAVKEDREMKKYIIKVDLVKYCLSSLDEVAYQKGKIYSLRGHFLIGRTYYNNRNMDEATYLIVEDPHVVNTLQLCTNTHYLNAMVKRFINQSPMVNDREIINLVDPETQGRHVQEFLQANPALLVSFLNKNYILVDKACTSPEYATVKIISSRKFISNMYEAKYFLEMFRRQ
jgi:hypothetical protein